jgi:hypothetical protein
MTRLMEVNEWLGQEVVRFELHESEASLRSALPGVSLA